MHYRAFKFYLVSTIILFIVGIIERIVNRTFFGFYASDIFIALLWAAVPLVSLYHFGKINENIENLYRELSYQLTDRLPEKRKTFESYTINLSKDNEMEVLAKELELMKEKKNEETK